MKNLSKKAASGIAAIAYVSLLSASIAVAAESQIYTGTFFDDSGAYFGPDCEKDGTQSTGAYYTGDYTSPFKTFLGKTDKDIQDKLDELWNHYFGGQNDKTVYYEDDCRADQSQGTIRQALELGQEAHVEGPCHGRLRLFRLAG